MIAMKKIDKKPTLIVMVGLPASGKSTIAKILENKRDFLHISSDAIRKELFESENNQEHNNEVFGVMEKRTKEALKAGKNVVYDATNISSKRRKHLLRQINVDCHKECIYMATGYCNCIDRDRRRIRNVGKEVIDKMFRNLEIPMWHEGWDKIEIVREFNEYRTVITPVPTKIEDMTLEKYQSLLSSNRMTRDNVGLAQDNKHHTLSVDRHMYASFEEALRDKKTSTEVAIACLLHDLGKSWTKRFKEDSRYACFYGHENISAQLALNICIDFGFSDEDSLYIATLVQLHNKMLLAVTSNDCEKSLRRMKSQIEYGKHIDRVDVLLNDLVMLYKADSLGR